MSVAGIFLLVAFLAGVTAIIVWPLFYGRREAVSDSTVLPSIARLQAQHEAILIAVRDLDFDFQTGKLTQEDYQSQRENLIARGVELLKEIDVRQSDLIEDAVRARRSTKGTRQA